MELVGPMLYFMVIVCFCVALADVFTRNCVQNDQCLRCGGKLVSTNDGKVICKDYLLPKEEK